MASMDLDTIIRDLNKRFAVPLPERTDISNFVVKSLMSGEDA